MSEPLPQHLNPDEIELWALGLLPAARALHLAECAACLATGALGYVVKSFIDSDLIVAMTEALAGRSFVSRFSPSQ